jgi:hypothetical protein
MMAVVQASRTLDARGDERLAAPGTAQTPGVVIVIHPAVDKPRTIDETPAASHRSSDRLIEAT